MYYKIEKESELGLKIAELFLRVNAMKEDISSFLDSIEAEQTILADSSYLCGGIMGIYFDKTPNMELWRTVKGQYGAFLPRAKQNRAMYDKVLYEFRGIRRDELDKIVGYKWQFKGLTCLPHVGYCEAKDFYLIEVHNDAKYTPLEGMTEILASEFKALSEEL